MNAGVSAVFFCLGTGAALGALFLLFKVLRLLLHAGKLLTAFLDVLFCCICGVVVFLCALAVDHGRLRLFQALLQALGAWAAVTALDTFVNAAEKPLRKISGPIKFLFGKMGRFLAPHFFPKREKSSKKQGKTRKKRKKSNKGA